MKIAVVGGGAGGTAAVAELVSAGHEVRLWSRTHETLAPFREQGGVAFDGIMGSGLAKPAMMTCDLAEATDGADLVLICVPTQAHGDVAHALARSLSRISFSDGNRPESCFEKISSLSAVTLKIPPLPRTS